MEVGVLETSPTCSSSRNSESWGLPTSYQVELAERATHTLRHAATSDMRRPVTVTCGPASRMCSLLILSKAARGDSHSPGTGAGRENGGCGDWQGLCSKCGERHEGAVFCFVVVRTKALELGQIHVVSCEEPGWGSAMAQVPDFRLVTAVGVRNL